MLNKIINWFTRPDKIYFGGSLHGKTETPLDGWSQSYDIGPLKQRLAGLDKTDPLYPLLLGFLDAQIVSQADARVSPDFVQQFAGRMSMCADLKHELRSLWMQSHTPPK